MIWYKLFLVQLGSIRSDIFKQLVELGLKMEKNFVFVKVGRDLEMVVFSCGFLSFFMYNGATFNYTTIFFQPVLMMVLSNLGQLYIIVSYWPEPYSNSAQKNICIHIYSRKYEPELASCNVAWFSEHFNRHGLKVPCITQPSQ